MRNVKKKANFRRFIQMSGISGHWVKILRKKSGNDFEISWSPCVCYLIKYKKDITKSYTT